MDIQLSNKLVSELDKLNVKCLSSEAHAESAQSIHEEDVFGLALTYEDGTVLRDIEFHHLKNNRIEIPDSYDGIVIDLSEDEAENAIAIRNFLYVLGEEVGVHMNPLNA